MNDSGINVVAFYAGFGRPESFNGLPGMIPCVHAEKKMKKSIMILNIVTTELFALHKAVNRQKNLQEKII